MKQIGTDEKKLLQEYFTCGTMKTDVLESIVNDMKKDKVLQKHPYQITPPTKDGGRYMTYILDSETNKRIKLTSYTEVEFIKSYISYIIQRRKKPWKHYIHCG